MSERERKRERKREMERKRELERERERCTCGSDRGLGRLHHVPVDGFGAWLLLQTPRTRFDDIIHVVHELELLPPHVFVLDVVSSGPLLISLLLLLLHFQSGGGGGGGKNEDRARDIQIVKVKCMTMSCTAF